MTRLDAINQMLRGIGEAPVSQEDSIHPDVLIATPLLDQLIEETLAVGYWFNTDAKLTLQPDAVTSKITVPSTALQIDPIDPTLNYVQRDGFLYNADDATFLFDDTVDCQIVHLLPFESCPRSCQAWIAASGAYLLHLSEVGDENKLNRLLAERRTSEFMFKRDEMRNSDFNATNTPSAQHMLAGMRPYRRF